MFAVGHFALAYLLGKSFAKALKVEINIPILLVLSVIPDIDIIFEFFLKTEVHRGPTHSILIAILAFAPFFILHRARAVPYFVALASHSLIVDYLVAGHVQLMWPLSTHEYCIHCDLGLPRIGVYSGLSIALELTLFAIALLIMVKTKDIRQFFRNSRTNLVLAIPILTVLLPTFLAFPLYVPPILIPPHLFFLIIFAVSVSVQMIRTCKPAFAGR